MEKFITNFVTTAEYNSAKSNFYLPHVSLTEDDMVVHYHPLVGAKLYDYLYEDGSFGKKDATKTAIGVCVIPGGVLPGGKARFMSLKGMSLTSPNEGGEDSTRIYWGGYGSDIPSLTNFNKVVTGDTTAEGTSYTGYLPKNGSYVDTPHIPSPIRYFSAYSSSGATSDLDGKANTEKILAVDNAASTDWQTASTIENLGSIDTAHSAAQCCWRFNPSSTNQGDWYLPAVGELAFIMPNFNNLQTAISDVGGVQLRDGGIYLSSTEASKSGAWTVKTGEGYVTSYAKHSDQYSVRAFLAL